MANDPFKERTDNSPLIEVRLPLTFLEGFPATMRTMALLGNTPIDCNTEFVFQQMEDAVVLHKRRN